MGSTPSVRETMVLRERERDVGLYGTVFKKTARERWVLMKIPRCDTNGESETKSAQEWSWATLIRFGLV